MEEHLGRPLLTTEEIHHIDEIKINNDPSNLEITTKSEHSRYHDSASTLPSQVGSLNTQAKLTETEVIKILDLVTSMDDIQNIANIYNIHYVTVWDIYKGRTWKHVPRVAHR